MIDVIYSDRHLVFVNKAAGTIVAQDKSGDQTLLEQVRAWYQSQINPLGKGYCVPIHFLDRPVSGVILFALSSKAASRLNSMFKQRTLQKSYLAVVHGRPKDGFGVLQDLLIKNATNNSTQISKLHNTSAKLSTLAYAVLQTKTNKNDNAVVSLLLVRPQTGRSHQIRVQLSHIGHPIIGDLRYGAEHGLGSWIALHAATTSASASSWSVLPSDRCQPSC